MFRTDFHNQVSVVTEDGRQDRQYADIRGVRTAYTDRGTGPALVMVHGVGLNASVWTPQLDEFATDHRVVAYDTLGHGGSTLPGAGASLVDYADQLQCLLDHLGIDRAVLIGHSMGALIAILFALSHAERVGGLVAANPVYRRPAAQLATSDARVRQIEDHGTGAGLDETLRRWFGVPTNPHSPQVEQVKRWISEADPQGYARAYRVFAGADPWLDGRLWELSMPALFVTGELDPNSTAGMSRTMAGDAPFGHALILSEERHMMSYISAPRFNGVLREFLDRLPENLAGEPSQFQKRLKRA